MRALRFALILVGVGVVLALVPAVHRSPDATYGGADPRLLVLEATAALSLMLVAALWPDHASAALVAAAGCLWLVPELAGTRAAPLVVRTLADAMVPLIPVVLLLALAVAQTSQKRRLRVPVLLASAGAALAGLARLVLVDPFARVGCWRTCAHNPVLLGDGTTGGLAEWAGLSMLATGVCVTVVLALAYPSGRAARSGLSHHVVGWLLPAALVLALVLAPGGATGATSEDMTVPVTVFVLVQIICMGWAAALAMDTVLRWRLESRLARLADLLGSGSVPAALTEALRDAVRDPQLRLVYWAPARGAYVDADGRLTDPARSRQDARTTVLIRRGERVAAIEHASHVDGPRLERALGPALRLALENEQLRAAALAELEALTRSRARVVERAALERRRLERNLHDGAQQRAVSLTLLVRLLADEAGAADAPALARSRLLARTLAEELRRVARGIYPAVLADAGLMGALVDLAEDSVDLPVTVEDFPEGRYPGVVEVTAYAVVRAGIADARDRDATAVSVEGVHVDGVLRVRIYDDGASTPVLGKHVADQVGAIGGTLVVDGTHRRRRVEVVLPCAL